MDRQEKDDNGLIIKIPSSILEKNDRNNDNLKVKNGYDFYRRTNIFPIDVNRKSEHGETIIQSLGFKEADQYLKVLELLDAHGIYNKLPNLLDYIYQVGCENEAEKRNYAAVAVSKLATKQPFLDLKEAVILPWAKNDNPKIRNSAAVALSEILEIKRNKSEILSLLKHWIGINNSLLTDSALSTFYLIAGSYPNETLEAIGEILKANKIIHYPKIIDLFETLYENSAKLAIDQLHSWLLPVKHTDLCWISGILFLISVELDDATKDEDSCKKVVEMVFALWDNPKMPLHEEMQERATILIETWASEAVEKMNTATSSDQDFQSFFHELHKKFKGRRNRLEFYLQRWERNKERRLKREQARADFSKEGSSLKAKDKFNFRHLLP